MYKIFDKAQRISYLDIPCYNYLQRKNSITRGDKINHDHEYAAYEQMRYLDEKYPDMKVVGHTAYASAALTVYDFYGNMSKEEFIRQRDAYRVQEDERMAQIQRLRTEKNQIFQPVKKDMDNLQAMMNTVGEAGDVMHLSQNVVEAFIDRIDVFNDERVKIRFTFEDTLNSYEEK